MNLTSKQRAYLGSEASTMNAIFQIGKASLTPELINGLDEALEKRELIKISVLKTVQMTLVKLLRSSQNVHILSL